MFDFNVLHVQSMRQTLYTHDCGNALFIDRQIRKAEKNARMALTERERAIGMLNA